MKKINRQILRILETADDAYGDLFDACNELYETLLNITGIDVDAEFHRQNLSVNSGKAIGLTWAAMCIKDIMRTKKFMNGIVNAVQDQLKADPKKTVHVLYSGTGPFATLVLPLIARFTSEQIRLSLLEVNKASFECMQQLVKTLEVEQYIQRLQNADATQLKIPADEEVNIFLCEAMQQALKSEPQVAICMNIMPQLSASTIMIPEEISLSAALINPQRRIDEKLGSGSSADAIHVLGDVFKFNKETILEQYAKFQRSNEDTYYFPPVTLSIPADLTQTYPELYLLTEINVYKKEKLLIDESALTLPQRLQVVNSSSTIQFQYATGNSPGVLWKEIDEPREALHPLPFSPAP